MNSVNHSIEKTTIIGQIRKELINQSDAKVRESSKRFFKEDVRTYGLKSSELRTIIKDYFKIVKPEGKTKIFSLCEELWQSGYLEETIIAGEWAYFVHRNYEPSDFYVFENWLDKYVDNWASCDTFCNHAIGEFIEMYPEFMSRLKGWPQSPNRWMRRGAAVSLIVPVRKGMFLNDVFEIADALLTDKEDLVQKGYGWMLKVASQTHQKEVFNFVVSRKKEMPRTALRYAIEKMPEELRKEAMKRDQ